MLLASCYPFIRQFILFSYSVSLRIVWPTNYVPRTCQFYKIHLWSKNYFIQAYALGVQALLMYSGKLLTIHLPACEGNSSLTSPCVVQFGSYIIIILRLLFKNFWVKDEGLILLIIGSGQYTLIILIKSGEIVHLTIMLL